MSSKCWLAAYGEQIPPGINPDAHGSVLEMLEGAMRRFADKPAFHCFGQTLTYADTDRLSRDFAAFLQVKLCVKKADRIAVMLPNIPAFPLAMLGIIRVGAVQVNINPLYTPRELEHQLNDAGVEIIVVFSGVSGTLAEIIERTKVKTVIGVGTSDGTNASIPSPPCDARLQNVIAFSEALARGADLSLTPVTVCGEDLLFLQYTGGTTGLSKGAALSHRNLVRTVQSLHTEHLAPGRGNRGHGVAALPHLRTDGEFHLLLLDWCAKLAGPQSARHGRLRRHSSQGALHHLHGGQHALRRAADASKDHRSRFHRATRRDRRRRGCLAYDIVEMEGAHRK